MANYKETTLNGVKWQRCNSVNIYNPLDGIPTAQFLEEIVTVIDNKPIQLGTTYCTIPFDQQNGIIPLVNPLTGESLGTTCTHVELYTILYSLYMQAAAARDAAQQTQ